MKILVTGGAGYIGSTVASACEDAGHLPIVLDDLSTGVAAFTRGRDFVQGDFADPAALDEVFRRHPDVHAVIHCAALIIVPESVEQPLRYYENNVAKTVTLLAELSRRGCRRLLFSSSGSVYASNTGTEVTEDAPLAQTSPYARTKAMVEQVIADAARAGLIRGLSLRYFNPVGADPRLRTGQQRTGHTLVLDRLVQAHRSGRPFTITGVDWPTRDGTAIRDYVHVWDVAQAHVAAVSRFDDIVDESCPYSVLNVGTGHGTTVRELVAAFGAIIGADVAVQEAPARPGDALGCYANVDRIATTLGWQADFDLKDAVRDALAWAKVRDDVLA